MANLTNSGKLITKIEAIDSSISDINDKIGSVPAGTDIMEEIGAVDDKVDGVIESIGTVPSGSTVMDEIGDVDSDLQGFKTTVSETYATKDSVASAFLYKGTKATYAELPSSGNKTGDVWNIQTADPTHDVKAGDNVVWSGTAWDVLSGIVDLSNYYTKAEVDAAIDAGGDAVEALAGRVTTAEGKITTLEGKMTTAEGDIDALEGRMDTAEDDIDAVEGRLDTAESDIDNLESDVAARYTKTEINTMSGLSTASAGFVSNTVSEAADGKVTATAADNVSIATAESNNKSAIANLGTAHNNLVDRVEAVESATGSLPFEAFFVNGTFSGKTLEISNANILASSHVSFVVTSGTLAGYYVEREVQAGKVTLTSSDNETATVEVMIINKKSS